MTAQRPTSDPPLTARGALRWAVVEPLLAGLKPVSVLEFGCGQGAVGARIARHASYTGVEPDQASYDVAAARITPRGGTVLHGDAGVLPWGTTYDVICSFEVLEHIPDDAGALRTWIKHVRPGGHVVVSVPEGPERFGPSDVQVGHQRRYTATDLEDLLTGAGLVDVRVQQYGWPLGYLLEAASNRAAAKAVADGATATSGPDAPTEAERTALSGRLRQPGALAGAVLRVGVRPFTVLQRTTSSRGIGLIGVAQRPG
jgi:SAM-dependent methyltransferase